MPFRTRSITSSRLMLLLAGSLMAVSLLVFASGALTSSQTFGAIQPEIVEQPAVAHSAQKRTTLVETELIAITQRGFEPKAITRPPGQFILMLENPNRQELNVQLSREAGESVNRVTTTHDEPDWNEIQNLLPGRYVLSIQDHPDWICVITITPH